MASYHLRLKNDSKVNGQKVSAKGHAEYILRAGEEKTDLIYQASQLPSLASGSAQKFFEVATRYEDKGNRRYKELEMSLPNELTLEQNLEIVNGFIAKHLSNHYYAYAVHEKEGALSGERHPHVHIMFSERLIDDVEKLKERPAYKYFKRAAKKESEVRELVRYTELAAKNFSEMYEEEVKKLNGLKRKFITTRENLEKAQAEYLTPSELKTFKAFKESLRQIYHLENLQKELKRPNERQIKNLEAYEEITFAISKKISTLKKTLKSLEVEKIEEKLQKPCAYRNIALVAHYYFQANRKILEKMAKTSEIILIQCHKMEEKSAVVIPEVFSISDLKDNLRLQYHSLKVQQETSESKLAELRQKVISPLRALLIAKNKFLKGDLKKLNAEKRKYEKAEKKFDSDFKFYEEEKFIFDNTNWKNSAEKFQRFYYLTKSKIELEHRQEEIKNWKKNLDAEENCLENLSTSESAKEKLGIIAASILRKNLPIAQAFEKEKEKFASIKKNLKLCKERLDFISDCKLKKKYFYRVIDSANLPRKTSEDQNAIISLIADALRGEIYAVSLVARSSGNNLEMEKTWELMSDLDKDELQHQKIFRNL